MKYTTIADAYGYFEQLHGGEAPIRTLDELRSLIHAADLRYDDIDARFWNLALGDEGEQSWALGTIDWPTDKQWAAFKAQS